MNLWLVMIVAGAITYGIRLSFISLVGARDLPASVRRGLRFVPPAVLAAVIFPELFLNGSASDISLANTRLVAGIFAAVVAWRTKNVALTIVAGMGAVLILQGLV